MKYSFSFQELKKNPQEPCHPLALSWQSSVLDCTFPPGHHLVLASSELPCFSPVVCSELYPRPGGSAVLTAPFLACLNEHGFHGSWNCCCSLSLCIILNKGNPKVAAMVLCSWGRSECVRARTVSYREGSQPLNGASYAARFLKISLGRVLLHLSFREQPHLSSSLGRFRGPAGHRARAHELMLERCILPTSKNALFPNSAHF